MHTFEVVIVNTAAYIQLCEIKELMEPAQSHFYRSSDTIALGESVLPSLFAWLRRTLIDV
jgi:hypothetical protein